MQQNFNNEFPWITFKLKNNIYSVNSQYVSAIMSLEQEIVSIPDSDECVRGIVTYREQPIKVLDLRKILDMSSVEEDYGVFQSMIDQRRQDHLNWMTALENSVEEDVPFTLATDPHKCAFGQWYYNFKSDINSVAFHLARIEEPHRHLHETALSVLGCERKCNECTRDECLKETLAHAREELVPEILELLDETKNVFKEHFKEMLIVVEVEGTTFGFLVDEVLSVEELQFLNDGEDHITKTFKTNLVTTVAKSKQNEALILILNLDALMQAFETESEIEDATAEIVT